VKRLYCYAGVGIFFAALACGVSGITAGWVLFGILGLICIYVAFPNVWSYVLWLGALYAFAGVGGALFTLADIHYLAVGTVAEVIALYIMFSLVRNVCSIRDSIKKEYNLGLWFLAVCAFFLFSAVSLYDWAHWAVEASELYLHVAAEVLLILLLFYILAALEENLGTGAAFVKRCPACNALLRVVRKQCPACAYEQSLYWCRRAEHYVILCQTCSELTQYSDSCTRCGEELPRELRCDSCGAAHRLGEWRDT
jgi:hypothetical protein